MHVYFAQTGCVILYKSGDLGMKMYISYKKEEVKVVFLLYTGLLVFFLCLKKPQNKTRSAVHLCVFILLLFF